MTKENSKVMTLPEAVRRLVTPGSSLAMGLGLEGFVPFASAHEIIRQKIGGLTLIGPISNICFDQIVLAGLAKKIIAAWVGNVSTGIGYNFRRAVEQGLPQPLEVINHSNFSISLALEAAARGLPMAVGRSPLGSDIIKDNPHFKKMTCPHSGETLLAIKAVKPDLAVVHVQRADCLGNCQAWGATGITRQAAMAAGRVLVTCEEVVEPEAIRADPDRTLIPGFVVEAVCEAPWGAHPAPVQGYYDLDGPFFREYAAETRDPAKAKAWLDEWVFGIEGRSQYMEKVGRERWQNLLVKNSRPTPPVEFGW